MKIYKEIKIAFQLTVIMIFLLTVAYMGYWMHFKIIDNRIIKNVKESCLEFQDFKEEMEKPPKNKI